MLSEPLPASSVPEDPIAATLDNEIAALHAQISKLKTQRALQATTILSSHRIQQTLSSLRAAQQSLSSIKQPSSSIEETTIDLTPLLTQSTAQSSHNTTNLYRALSSITTFHLTDPDPHAVDNGHILGLRFDICVGGSGKFTKPYYIMLNHPFGPLDGGDDEWRKELLRIHRHTLPPCIPLSELAKRHLPNGKGAVGITSKAGSGAKRQDLKAFVRAVRRELVGYHKRISTIKALRKEFSLDERVKKGSRKGKEREEEERVIADITAADAEARQVRIEWVDGRIGRVLVGDGGVVKKCVVIGEGGRDREVERRVVGERGRMEEIGERLREGIY